MVVSTSYFFSLKAVAGYSKSLFNKKHTKKKPALSWFFIVCFSWGKNKKSEATFKQQVQVVAWQHNEKHCISPCFPTPPGSPSLSRQLVISRSWWGAKCASRRETPAVFCRPPLFFCTWPHARSQQLSPTSADVYGDAVTPSVSASLLPPNYITYLLV